MRNQDARRHCAVPPKWSDVLDSCGHCPTLHWALLLASVQHLTYRLERAEPPEDSPHQPKAKSPYRSGKQGGPALTGLSAHLLRLSPDAYELLIARLLERMGYRDVTRLREDDPSGRVLRGGAHLSALLSEGTRQVKVLVCLKQYAYPVPRRFVDELRGALLRHEAQAGLVIGISTFPPAAHRAAREDAHLPVFLLDGPLLGGLLAQHGLAVEQLADGSLVPTPDFFQALEAEAPPAG